MSDNPIMNQLMQQISTIIPSSTSLDCQPSVSPSRSAPSAWLEWIMRISRLIRTICVQVQSNRDGDRICRLFSPPHFYEPQRWRPREEEEPPAKEMSVNVTSDIVQVNHSTHRKNNCTRVRIIHS